MGNDNKSQYSMNIQNNKWIQQINLFLELAEAVECGW